MPKIPPTDSARQPVRRLALLAATVALCLPTLAAAQSRQGSSPQSRSAEPVGVRLQNQATRIDPLDLSFFLPQGSVAETTSFGANATMGVELPDKLGVLVVKGQRSNNNELTVKEVADSMIEQLQQSRGIEDARTGNFRSAATLIDRTTVRVSGLSGERFYLRFAPGADGTPAMVRGISVFRSEPGRFIVFDLMTDSDGFDTARRVYETVVGTAQVTDRDALAARRSTAITNLRSVLDSITPEDLKRIAERYPERWERLNTPAASGDEMDATEHGYRRIRIRTGVRGEVSGRPERTWRAGDRIPGLIVQLDAMALESELRVDTRAIYFVSEDFKEESWTVKMALRQGPTTTESSITGARSGTSMTVQLQQGSSSAPTVTRPVIQGEGYISQAIMHILAPILVENAEVGPYAGYAYNPSTNTISLRWDTVEQPADKPGLWIIRSRPDDNTPAVNHVFNARGDLMRSEMHNGRLWEPITLDRLVNLWRRKGLPLE